MASGLMKNSHRSAVDLISKLCKKGQWKDAISVLYLLNNEPDFEENCNAYGFVLQACAKAEALAEGKHVHSHIIKTRFEQDRFVGNHLLNMYAKCRSIEAARQVFDKMPHRNVVSWTAIIAGCAQNGHAGEALKLFDEMHADGIRANDFTLASVINACAGLSNLEKGKSVHDDIKRNGLESNAVISSALVDMYAKCGRLEDARKVFDGMSKRDVVSWTSLIAGYTEHGYAEKALELFAQKFHEGLKPDHFTFSAILSTCSRMAGLGQGKQVHAHLIQMGFECNGTITSALVDMYTKCGDIEDAHNVFDKISERNVVSWSAMIGGYAHNGRSKEALELFEEMILAGIKPNEVTFIGVLYACSHAGFVSEGCYYFGSMTLKYGINPNERHYTCMVDLLGRAGCLKEAEIFIKQIPSKPVGAVWAALLSACRIHGNTELAKHAADQLLGLKQQVATTYIALSNAYAADGRWEDVARVRNLMKQKGLRKEPGCSWIEVKNKMHAFFCRRQRTSSKGRDL